MFLTFYASYSPDGTIYNKQQQTTLMTKGFNNQYWIIKSNDSLEKLLSAVDASLCWARSLKAPQRHKQVNGHRFSLDFLLLLHSKSLSQLCSLRHSFSSFDSLTHEQLQEVMSLHELTSLTHRCVCTCSLTVCCFLLRNTRQTHQCGVTNHRLTLCLDRYVTYINQTLIRISRTVHVLFTSLFPAVLHLSGTPNP